MVAEPDTNALALKTRRAQVINRKIRTALSKLEAIN
jgi:hypothetical protein